MTKMAQVEERSGRAEAPAVQVHRPELRLHGRERVVRHRRSSAADRPFGRVVEKKHSTDVGARLSLSVNAHTEARIMRRRRRRFNIGRVLVLPGECSH